MTEQITPTELTVESINEGPLKIVQRPLATSIRGRKEEIAGKIITALVATTSLLAAGGLLINASWVEFPLMIEAFQKGNFGESAYQAVKFGGEVFLANTSAFIFRLSFIKP